MECCAVVVKSSFLALGPFGLFCQFRLDLKKNGFYSFSSFLDWLLCFIAFAAKYITFVKSGFTSLNFA